MNRRGFLTGVALAVPFLALPKSISFSAPLAVRGFDDEEPFGFQPPHTLCKTKKPKKDKANK